MVTFAKHDTGKSRLDLVPPRALLEIGDVLAFGAAKYAPDNWRRVDDRRRYAAAALRHVTAWLAGDDVDDESGLSHLAHAATCLLMLRECEIECLGDDTRWVPPPGQKG